MEPQCSGSLTDSQHRYSFSGGKAELRQGRERIHPAEVSANHLQAGYATLHTVMLPDYRKVSHPLYKFCFIFNEKAIFYFPLPNLEMSTPSSSFSSVLFPRFTVTFSIAVRVLYP